MEGVSYNIARSFLDPPLTSSPTPTQLDLLRWRFQGVHLLYTGRNTPEGADS